MIALISAWRRTRKALRKLERDIAVARIVASTDPKWTTCELSRAQGLYYKPTYSMNTPELTDECAYLQNLCKQYLIIKAVGADSATLYKLATP